MRPDAETTNAFVYCLAISAERFGFGVIGFGTMSNHYHAVVVDNEGRLPEFLQYFHRTFAVHQNVLRGRWEAFWTPNEQPSTVRLVQKSDLVDKLVYAITNPIKDGLVDRLEHWPGPNCVSALNRKRELVATRPKRFFRENGDLPLSATINLVQSPMHSDLTMDEWVELIDREVSEHIVLLRHRRIAKGQRVLGAKGVLAQHWNESPSSIEPRREINPRVACRNKWRRVEELSRNREWIDAYRDARRDWLAGVGNVIFPYGVWSLRHAPGVRCADPPAIL
jgi:putative transposase